MDTDMQVWGKKVRSGVTVACTCSSERVPQCSNSISDFNAKHTYGSK